MSRVFDVVVIGGGPGGYAAALYGANAGLSVAVVEKEKVGGTCLHRGCIPAKEFLETAAVYRTVESSKEFGVLTSSPGLDFGITQDRKQKVVDQLWRGLSGLMKSRKIETIEASGTYLGEGNVQLSSGEIIMGSSVILASGSVPRTIPGFEIDREVIITSDEVLALTKLPSSVAVIGGGAIGCEFASMMSDLGVSVTIIEALPSLLAGCDKDVAEVVARSFRKRGIVVHTGVSVSGHERDGSNATVYFGEDKSITVDVVIMAIGRKPFSDGLVADGAGVSIDQRGFVNVDSFMRTSAAGVYAIGDVVDTPALAHVGFAEAIVAIKSIIGETVVPVDYTKVPWCIYTHPEIAFAGLTEEAAHQAGYEINVKKDPFGGNSRARIIGETEGLVKVISERRADGRAGKILGVHMAGPWVTEQLGMGYLALNWEATPDEIAQFIQPHPTLSETFGETVIALTGRGLHVG